MNNKLKDIFIILISFFAGGLVVLTVLFMVGRNNMTQEQDHRYMASVVVDGYEMDIPNRYKATMIEDMGLMYWDEDNFQMLISVIEGDYDELRAGLSDSKFTMSDAEGSKEIIPFTELAIGGRSYLYMMYEDGGDLILYAYSPPQDSAESNKIFEMTVVCHGLDNMRPQTTDQLARECEQLLLITDSLLSTASSTHKENTAVGEVFISDSVYDELRLDISINVEEELISEDCLLDNKGNVLVAYDVADNFCYGGELGGNKTKPLKLYYNYDENANAKVYVQASGITAKDYVSQGAATWGDLKTQVYNTTIGQHEFWYYTYSRSYNYEGENVTESYLIAATDLKEGQIYCIVVEAADLDTDLLGISEKFMNFKDN